MPHRCTKCGRIYPDGDKRILKGCECGNNKFIYVPKEKKLKEAEKVKEVKGEPLKVKAGREKEVEKRVIDAESVESVKILNPGTYEINLEKIFSREEIIIALQEDGRYAIHLPSLVGKLEKKLERKKSDKKQSNTKKS